MFDVQQRLVGESMVLDMSGSLSREGGEMVLRVVEQITPRPRRLVLNFTGVPMMNTAGLGGVLWAVRSLFREGVQVCAFGLTDHFRKVFHVMGLTEYIAVVSSEAEAVGQGRTAE